MKFGSGSIQSPKLNREAISGYIYSVCNCVIVFGRITHTDLHAARDWLLEMGRGATVTGLDLIYCMALPRQILQSVEIEAVKTARVSGDYLLSKVRGRS